MPAPKLSQREIREPAALPIPFLFAEATLPTRDATYRVCVFRDVGSQHEQVALVLGDITEATDLLVRAHSECLTGDALGSTRCDCREQLLASRRHIARNKRGILLYLRQEGRGIGLGEKIRAYALQEQGLNTFAANRALGLPEDARDYRMAAAILKFLGVRSVALMTNNPHKLAAFSALGVEITRRVPLVPHAIDANRAYLRAKVEVDGHLMPCP